MGTLAINPSANPVLETLLNSQRFHAKVLELYFLNFSSACKYAGKWSKARSPKDCMDLAVDQFRDQFETMTEQIEELSLTLNGAPASDASPPPIGD